MLNNELFDFYGSLFEYHLPQYQDTEYRNGSFLNSKSLFNIKTRDAQ